MTARENRKARRQAERKARKQERKEAPLAAPVVREQPTAVPQSSIAIPARLAELHAQSERELEAEFGNEFLAHARATGDRIARRAGLLTGSESSFRNIPEPAAPGRSTGPRTPEGKLSSSRNSLKHGLSTGTLLIPGEDAAAFEALRADLHREHQPACVTEQLLVDDLAQSHWLRQRALRLQNQCFTADGGVDEKRLALFLRYGTAHERAFHKALAALLRLQKERRKTAPSVAPSVRGPEFVSQSAPASSSTLQFVSQNAAPSRLPTQHPSDNRARNTSVGSPSVPHAA